MGYSESSINELLLYFSILDIDYNPTNIKNVKIKDWGIDKNQNIHSKVEGTSGNYEINIDFKNRVIKHNCFNFLEKRAYNKKFCKHLTKLFIEICKEKGQEYVKILLIALYYDLDSWEFN